MPFPAQVVEVHLRAFHAWLPLARMGETDSQFFVFEEETRIVVVRIERQVCRFGNGAGAILGSRVSTNVPVTFPWAWLFSFKQMFRPLQRDVGERLGGEVEVAKAVEGRAWSDRFHRCRLWFPRTSPGQASGPLVRIGHVVRRR